MRRRKVRPTPERTLQSTVRRVRCRFCDFTRPVWFTSPSGGRANGFNVLANHVEAEHPEEYAGIQRHLEETCKTEPEPSP